MTSSLLCEWHILELFSQLLKLNLYDVFGGSCKECSYSHTPDQRPILPSGWEGRPPLPARSFGREAQSLVREGGDTRLASQISRIYPDDQWGDRRHSQIALTSSAAKIGGSHMAPKAEHLFSPFTGRLLPANTGYQRDVSHCPLFFHPLRVSVSLGSGHLCHKPVPLHPLFNNHWFHFAHFLKICV